MRTIGIITEMEAYQLNRKNAGNVGQVETDELLAVLVLYCGYAGPSLPPRHAQLLMGAMVLSDFTEKGQPVSTIMRRDLCCRASHNQPVTRGYLIKKVVRVARTLESCSESQLQPRRDLRWCSCPWWKRSHV